MKGEEKGAVRWQRARPIKQAVTWTDDQLIDRPSVDRVTLVDEAAHRFDLSLLDTDLLVRHLAERARQK